MSSSICQRFRYNQNSSSAEKSCASNVPSRQDPASQLQRLRPHDLLLAFSTGEHPLARFLRFFWGQTQRKHPHLDSLSPLDTIPFLLTDLDHFFQPFQPSTDLKEASIGLL
jgi:hypothetical protein